MLQNALLHLLDDDPVRHLVEPIQFTAAAPAIIGAKVAGGTMIADGAPVAGMAPRRMEATVVHRTEHQEIIEGPTVEPAIAGFKVMKDGAMVCNSGHFDVEINLVELKALAGAEPKLVRNNVQEYIVAGKRIYVLAEGRLVNLAAAEGHPASVMDMSFATQALASAWMATQSTPLAAGVYEVPDEMEERVASLKLAAMGQTIDILTPKQAEYLNSWQHGT